MSCIGGGFTTLRAATPEPVSNSALLWPQIGRNAIPHSTGHRKPEDSSMQTIFRAAMIAATALVLAAAPAAAQGSPPEIKQIKLTEKQVQSFIAAQSDLNTVTSKIKGDKPDPKLVAELEAAAKKHGFANLQELDDVAGTISLVMSGFDPKTKEFSQPPEALKKEIAAVTADKSIPEKEKKEILNDLNAALKFTKPVQFPENVELIRQYYDKIEAAMPKG
jgi:hypothetical protein